MSIENVTQAKASIASTAAYKLLESFFDDGDFMSVDVLAKSRDSYAEVVAGYGTVEGVFVYAFVQNPDFCGGAMSKAQAAKLKKIYDLALKTGAPVVGFYDSKGGRLDEGNALLQGYGEVLNAASQLSGVVPQISVVLGDCIGTSALNASCADFVIVTKGSRLSLDQMGGNCDADYNAKSGVASVVAEDSADAVEKAKELVTYLPLNNIVEPYAFESADPEPGDCIGSKVVDAGSAFKLSKDFGDISRTAFGRIDGKTVGLVNTLGGIVSADDANKIAKFVRFCDAFSLPVLTFVNAEGFEDIKSAAKVTSAYAEATTAKISVVTGTAVGASYIALAGAGANADVVFALDGAVISPVSVEAAALILAPEKMNVPVAEQKAAAAQFAAENLSAEKACENGYVDDVLTEDELRKAITTTMYMLSGKRVETLSKKHSTI